MSQANAEAKGDQWEYCQVYREMKREGRVFTKMVCLFYADALHPTKGKYTAAKSEQFKLDEDDLKFFGFGHFESPKKFLDDFATKLTRDGWEPIPERGADFWHLRFKRRI